MSIFDFHHHKKDCNSGIYNLDLTEKKLEHDFSIGLLPEKINADFEILFLDIVKKAQHKNCIAIGECGLDSRIKTPPFSQEHVFVQHLKLAESLEKPIIIHCVKRFQETISLCEKFKIPKIIHGFNKNKSTANELLKNNFYLSFGKAVFQNVSLQEIIKEIPINSLFLETDNADFNLFLLYEKVAELKRISVENLQEKLNSNLEKIKTNAR